MDFERVFAPWLRWGIIVVGILACGIMGLMFWLGKVVGEMIAHGVR